MLVKQLVAFYELSLDIAAKREKNRYTWSTMGKNGPKRQDMLLGQYDGKAAENGRITIPSKFRASLEDLIIITKGYENSLIIVSEQGWKALLEGTEGRPFTDLPTRETQRFLLGGATDAQIDDKGRFIIPSYLRNYAGIENEIVFVGVYRYVEVWDKKRWNEYSSYLEENIATIAKRLQDRERKD